MKTLDEIRKEYGKEFYNQSSNRYNPSYVEFLEEKITSHNSDYTKCSEEIQEMCMSGASQSDIIDYLSKHFA